MNNTKTLWLVSVRAEQTLSQQLAQREEISQDAHLVELVVVARVLEKEVDAEKRDVVIADVAAALVVVSELTPVDTVLQSSAYSVD